MVTVGKYKIYTNIDNVLPAGYSGNVPTGTAQMKANNTVGFRPWPENKKRLELAEQIGLNISELLNETLKNSFDDVSNGTTNKRILKT